MNARIFLARAFTLAVFFVVASLAGPGCSSSEFKGADLMADASPDVGSDLGTTELGFADTSAEDAPEDPDLTSDDVSDELPPEPLAETVMETAVEPPSDTLEPRPESIMEEVSPELPLEIIPETDAEIITGAAKAYLVTSLSVDAPELCMPTASNCVPMNGLLSAYFQSAIDDHEEPLLVMALFEAFLDDSAPQSMRFGNASCDWDDGLAQSCAFDLSDPKNVAELSASYVLSGACGEGITGPCFQTDPQQVFLAFPLFGTHFGLLAAELRGAFQGVGLAEMSPGEIRGFLPRALAEKYQIAGFGAEPVLVSDLFVEPSVDVNGVNGWWMTLSVSGRSVDYAE